MAAGPAVGGNPRDTASLNIRVAVRNKVRLWSGLIELGAPLWVHHYGTYSQGHTDANKDITLTLTLTLGSPVVAMPPVSTIMWALMFTHNGSYHNVTRSLEGPQGTIGSPRFGSFFIWQQFQSSISIPVIRSILMNDE